MPDAGPARRWVRLNPAGVGSPYPGADTPLSHPIDQPVPGPRGSVPANWKARLHA
jgi:hypothetical protein